LRQSQSENFQSNTKAQMLDDRDEFINIHQSQELNLIQSSKQVLLSSCYKNETRHSNQVCPFSQSHQWSCSVNRNPNLTLLPLHLPCLYPVGTSGHSRWPWAVSLITTIISSHGAFTCGQYYTTQTEMEFLSIGH
jgi:hypothetical protein